MKKWKPERRDGLLLLGIGLGAAHLAEAINYRSLGRGSWGR